MRLIDSHSHIDVAEFDVDRAQALARAKASGVDRQIVPAIEAVSWPRLKATCESHSGLYPAYGLHPVYLERHRERDLIDLGDWVTRERPAAIGECGLDLYAEGLDLEAQKKYFLAQLALAKEFALPVIVHARRAVEAVILCIKRIGGVTGIVHSFGGSAEQARQLFALGFLLGFGGPCTYPNAHRLRKVVRDMPLEQLVLETDSPDQPLYGHQGWRNEPVRLVAVLNAVAEIRAQAPEEIAVATTANVERVIDRLKH